MSIAESNTVGTALDKLALALCLGGVVLGVLIALIGRMVGQEFVMAGYGVFVAFEVAAIILGGITRATTIGKTAMITSCVLLGGSVLFMA